MVVKKEMESNQGCWWKHHDQTRDRAGGGAFSGVFPLVCLVLSWERNTKFSGMPTVYPKLGYIFFHVEVYYMLIWIE